MATPTMAIHRIRRARRRHAPPPSASFEQYRREYRRILEEMASCLGEPGVDEVTDWIVERTEETGTLPDPAAVRRRALAVCQANDVAPPPGSVLTATDE